MVTQFLLIQTYGHRRYQNIAKHVAATGPGEERKCLLIFDSCSFINCELKMRSKSLKYTVKDKTKKDKQKSQVEEVSEKSKPSKPRKF